jgi:hypothetical protein
LIFNGPHGVISQKIELFTEKFVDEKRDFFKLKAANFVSYLINRENNVFLQLVWRLLVA